MEEYLRYSRLTGKKYNVFECVKIYNMNQAMAYFDNGVLPVDIKIGENKSTGKPIFIFYFIKEETKDVYEAWINHSLEVGNDIMRN